MGKYTKEIKLSELNPMETAPLYDYYDGEVETVLIFIDYNWRLVPILAFYDRLRGCWVDWYSEKAITEPLAGWLPDFTVVK